MKYKQLGGINWKYYTLEIHGEIREISSSREHIEGMIKQWGPVPNSEIKCYYLKEVE